LELDQQEAKKKIKTEIEKKYHKYEVKSRDFHQLALSITHLTE